MTDRLEALWHARYRNALPDRVDRAVQAGGDLLESLLGHRSVRSYLPDALPPGTLEKAVAAAQSAATSSNLQSWSVVAVEDAARRSRLAALCGNQAHIAVAPLFMVWLADLSRVERIATRAGLDHGALDHTETFLVATIDAALAAQNAVAALEAAGLGTVYIGGLRNHPAEIAKELHLPQRCMGMFGLCVGWPDPGHPASIKPRLPQDVVLHREHYDPRQEEALIAAYDVCADTFQKEQGLPSRAWSLTVAERLSEAERLGGRETMRESLAARGFPLA